MVHSPLNIFSAEGVTEKIRGENPAQEQRFFLNYQLTTFNKSKFEEPKRIGLTLQLGQRLVPAITS